jgi:hypothetical protein
MNSHLANIIRVYCFALQEFQGWLMNLSEDSYIKSPPQTPAELIRVKRIHLTSDVLADKDVADYSIMGLASQRR